MSRNVGRAAVHSAAAREAGAQAQLRSILEKAGWTVDHPGELIPGGRRLDLIAAKKGKRLAIELKGAAEGRPDRLIALWAQGWLQAVHGAPPGAIPVAVVAAESIAPKAAEAVLQFATEHAPEAHAGVIDRRGLVRFHGPLLHDLRAEPVNVAARVRSGEGAVGGNLFSALNQWMLKLLLAPRLDPRFLRAPRESYSGPSALAAAAGVSVMSASRFLRLLSAEGYLDERSVHIRLVRVADLLHAWQRAAESQPRLEVGWRAKARLSGTVFDSLLTDLRKERGCLALFAAARALGLRFTEDFPPYLYVRDPRTPWEGFRLAGPGEVVEVYARRPNAERSVFECSVPINGGRASDIIQVWLDVKGHPSRGEEQAGLIWERVLGQLIDD
ncbi:MAG TPA: hypothetical protein VFI39_00595 [Gemmatimonadales bacterium]|nr:hypothetical protein [Gemmatimonadales bacterium]